MAKITVHHSDPCGNGDVSVFGGPGAWAEVDRDGSLVVGNCETETETCEARFPAGHWFRVVRACPKGAPETP